MQFIDLGIQQKRIRQEIESRIRKVLDHGQYIMGPEIQELERELAAYVGVRHAVGCASGTDGLLLALMAHGTGPGDVVLTTPFTFTATAQVVCLLGAIPVFVDIEASTFNMDPFQLDKAIDALKNRDPGIYPLPRNLPEGPLRIQGVIAVDLFGLPADYRRINTSARERGLVVIEDAAQSFGAEYFGRKTCSLSGMACTSFFPAKPLGGYGDGGMCFTDDDDMAERMRSLRIHGQGRHKYENIAIGINGRLDTLQAAVLLAKFRIFQEEMELRQNVAGFYTHLLDTGPAVVSPPRIPPGYLSAWAQYTVLASGPEHRTLLQDRLGERGIPTAVYYPTPLHLQPAFRFLGYTKGDFPVSESCAERVLSLPMHPYLAKADQERIVEALRG
ncbi:MAG: DegT/DnrJ/EryC1/StrS family aminotransferase [Syntrophobacteraceae bacterium]|nr:DegT/DnrJ/EryC1/StrS family aminotransferase [Syntrophobacteraceae bacterium]